MLDHQKKQVTKIIRQPRVNKKGPRLDQDSTSPLTMNKEETEATNGQGEGVTR